jgi:hypothetical protein
MAEKEEYVLWRVSYCTSDDTVEVEYGTLLVIARNEYEAIGKAMTMPKMETVAVLPDSLEAKPVELLHHADRKFVIKLEELLNLKDFST